MDILKELPHESVDIEYKKAEDSVPRSFWETYSSFANTRGGYIILGVSESGKGYRVTGVKSADKMVDNLWNMLNNQQKVSSNILVGADIRVIEEDGKTVIIVHVPEADRRIKPVFIGGNMNTGTYVRFGEGDHHCDRARLNEMIRDSEDIPDDSIPLANIPMESIESETVKRYRTLFAEMNPGNPYNMLDDEKFLELLGAVGKVDGGLHPTKAGVLMFCDSLHIVKAYPNYFLDFREFGTGDTDWTDRVSSMKPGNNDNVFDFFRSVSLKVWNSLPEPLEFDDRMLSRNDNSLRKASRELITNALLHADYQGSMGVVIDLYKDRLVISNPGLFRIPVNDAVQGGKSNPRNPTLFRMFGLIGAVEQAGTGVNRSIRGIESFGLDSPLIEQTYEPSRTTITINLKKMRSKDVKETIIKMIKEDPNVSIDTMSSETGLSRNKIYSMLKEMTESDIIRRVGPSRGGRWEIA